MTHSTYDLTKYYQTGILEQTTNLEEECPYCHGEPPSGDGLTECGFCT